MFGRIERGTIPWVAALHGAVVGGGLELAASVQIRVADPTAFFALPEGQRGIFVGGGGSVRVARIIGAHRMADLMLTGRTVSAAEGERWGLVNYLTEAGGALDKAVALADAAAENAEMSNWAVLNALPRIRDMSSEDGLFAELLMATLTTTTPEAQERLRAFLEKRARPLEPAGDADGRARRQEARGRPRAARRDAGVSAAAGAARAFDDVPRAPGRDRAASGRVLGAGADRRATRACGRAPWPSG